MMNENQSKSISRFIYDESQKIAANIKAFHYEKAIDEKITGQNPMSLFECCLIDHSGRQFACIHEDCLDFQECTKNEHLNNNLAFHKLQFHSDDLRIWTTEAYPDIVMIINSAQPEERVEFRFIFNQRYIHQEDGLVSQFIHEGSVCFSGDMNLPRLKLNVFSEIGDFKTDDTVILTIFRYNANIGYRKVFRKVYGGKFTCQLSQREMEIIRLCYEGQSSKMIADTLNLSIHTVKNHKRNCMEKTLTHNITELIHLCIQNGWM